MTKRVQYPVKNTSNILNCGRVGCRLSPQHEKSASHMAPSIKNGCSEGSLTKKLNSFIFICWSTGGLIFQKYPAFLQQSGSIYFWQLPWSLASSMENTWQEQSGSSSTYLWFCQRHCMPVQNVLFWNKFPLFFSMLAVLHLSCWGETRS